MVEFADTFIGFMWITIIVYAFFFLIDFAPRWVRYQNALGSYRANCIIPFWRGNLTWK